MSLNRDFLNLNYNCTIAAWLCQPIDCNIDSPNSPTIFTLRPAILHDFRQLTSWNKNIGYKYGSDDPKRANDPKNFLKMREDIEKMCNQLGVTLDEYSAYRDKLEDGDFTHYRELLVKANARASELRKGEK